MEFKFSDVNEAFRGLVEVFDNPLSNGLIQQSSRNGGVVRFSEPVTVTYEHPTHRVLQHTGRDCNPFFHLYEALWMLAGHNDVAPLAWYNSNIANYSDDGTKFHGAYGHRWRKWFGYDQLDSIVDNLSKDPNSRRVVLQMWDSTCEPPHADTEWSDPYKAVSGGKDVPCNTQAYFQLRSVNEGTYLDMTVCNRSNDAIWGMLGANVVHFSILQEYLAARLDVNVGLYHQFTNNLHIYTNKFDATKFGWNNSKFTSCYYYTNRPRLHLVPLVQDPQRFERELYLFVDNGYSSDVCIKEFYLREPFIADVAVPMAKAFAFHKDRDYSIANAWVSQIKATDWQDAAAQWIEKRQRNWEAKQNG